MSTTFDHNRVGAGASTSGAGSSSADPFLDTIATIARKFFGERKEVFEGTIAEDTGVDLHKIDPIPQSIDTFANFHAAPIVEATAYNGTSHNEFIPMIRGMLKNLMGDKSCLLTEEDKVLLSRAIEMYYRDLDSVEEISKITDMSPVDLDLSDSTNGASKLADKYYREVMSTDRASMLAEKYYREVMNLKEGDDIVLPAGWKGSPAGHTILLRFSRTNNGFNLAVINTGEGSEYHVNNRHAGKHKIVPVQLFEKIPITQLSQDFFFSLAVPKAMNRADGESAKYDANFIYNLLFSPLSSFRSTKVYNFEDLITRQRGGTCVVKASEVLLRMRLLENGATLNHYKKLIFFMKALSLFSMYTREKDSLFSDNNKSRVLRRFLKESCGALMRMTSKALQKNNPLADLSQVKSMIGLTKKMLQEIKAKEKALRKASFQRKINYTLGKASLVKGSMPYRPNPREMVPNILTPTLQIFNRDQITNENICVAAEMCLTNSKKLKNEPRLGNEAAKKQVEQFISQLSLDKEDSKLWGAFKNVEEMKKAMKALLDLQSYYISFFQNQGCNDANLYSLNDEQNTILAFYAFAHILAIKIEGELIKLDPNIPRITDEFKFNLSHLHTFATSRWVFFSPEDVERRKDLMKYYLENIPKGNFDFCEMNLNGLSFEENQVQKQINSVPHIKTIFDKYENDLNRFYAFNEEWTIASRHSKPMYKNQRVYEFSQQIDKITPVRLQARQFCELYTDHATNHISEPSKSFFAQKGWEHMGYLKRAALFLKQGVTGLGVLSNQGNSCSVQYKVDSLGGYVTAKAGEVPEIFKIKLGEGSRGSTLANYLTASPEPLGGSGSDLLNQATNSVSGILSRNVLEPSSERDHRGLSWIESQLRQSQLSYDLVKSESQTGRSLPRISETHAIHSTNEPALRVMELLAFFKLHSSLLEKKEYQDFFIEQFFKSILNKSGSIETAFDVSEWDTPGFREALGDFFLEAEKRYQFTQNLEGVSGRVFFAKVARMLLPYYKVDSLFFEVLRKESLKLPKWITEELPKQASKDVVKVATGIVHREMLLYYKAFYDMNGKKNLPEGFSTDVVKSFLYTTVGSIPHDFSYRHEDRLIKKFVYEFLSKDGGASFEEVKNNLSKITKEVGLPVSAEGDWDNTEADPHVFDLHLRDEDETLQYSINLQTGELIKAGEGLLAFNINMEKLFEERNYKELFGEDRVDPYRIGKYVYFTHTGREFRYLYGEPTFNLEWKMLENPSAGTASWVQFIASNQEPSLGLPLALRCDHHLFVGDSSLGVCITDKKGNLEYVIQAKNDNPNEKCIYKVTISSRGNVRELTRPTGTIDLVKSEKTSLVNCFERTDFTYFETDNNNNEYLTFSRYEAGGKPLRFRKEAGTDIYLYEDDPRYYLVQEVPSGMLNHFHSFLLLAPKKDLNGSGDRGSETSSDDSHKEVKHLHISQAGENLIAVIPDINYGLSMESLIGGSQLATDEVVKDERLTSQNGTRKYFTIPIQKGELVPRNDEEFLISAYLLLGQRDYSKAIEYLKQVSPSVFLSEKAEDILERIIKLANETDVSVEAKAIGLQAYHIFLERKKIKIGTLNNSKLTNEHKLILKNFLSVYIDQISRVPEVLRLSRRKELDILEIAIEFRNNSAIEKSLFEDRNNLLLQKERDGVLSFLNGLGVNAENVVVETNSLVLVPEEPANLEGVTVSLEGVYKNKGKFSENTQFWKMYELVTTADTAVKRESVEFILKNIINFYKANAFHAIFFYNIFIKSQGKPPFPTYTAWAKDKEEKDPTVFLYKNYRGVVQTNEKGAPIELNGQAKREMWKKELGIYYRIQSFFNVSLELKPIQARAGVDIPTNPPVAKIDHNHFPFSRAKVNNVLMPKLDTNKNWVKTLEEIKREIIKNSENGKCSSDVLNEDKLLQDIEGVKKAASDTDHNMRSAVTTSVNEFIDGYQHAYEKRMAKKVPDFTVDEIQDRIKVLNTIISDAKADFEESKQDLVNRVNQYAFDNPIDSTIKEAEIVAGSQKKITMSDLAYLFVHREVAEYEEMIPQIRGNKEQLDKIATDTANTLYLGIKLHELEELKKGLEKVQNDNKNRSRSLEELVRIAKEGTDPINYENRPSLLAFEYSKGLTFRKEPDQVEAILHMEREEKPGQYESSLSQIPMGGGKTSVLIANLLAIRKGIPILITPAFQFQTIFQSIKKTLKESFNVETIAFNYAKNDLTPEVLQYILQTLRSILNGPLESRRQVLVLCPEMLQILELEFLASLHDFQKSEGKVVDQETLGQRVKTLAEILQLFREQGNAVGDEVQTLFDINKEVNFSLGIPENINSSYLDLLKTIFTVISTKSVKLTTSLLEELCVDNVEDYPLVDQESDLREIKIEDLLQLRRNRQKYFPKELFKEVIIPVITDELSAEYEPLKLKNDRNRAKRFSRYVAGVMNGDIERVIAGKKSRNEVIDDLIKETRHQVELIQAGEKSIKDVKSKFIPIVRGVIEELERPGGDRDLDQLVKTAVDTYMNEFDADQEFVTHLRNLRASPDENVKLSSDLIALTKHLLGDVVSHTIAKMGNISYGRGKDKQSAGKVKPYVCASTPATTEFAYHYEAAAFHLATALHYGVEKEQLLEIAETYHKDAMSFLVRCKSYQTTPPARVFEKLIGCFPNELKRQVDTILEKINNNPMKLLEVEAMTIATFVQYYPLRITSNAHSLFSMLHSFTATGGTIDPFVLPIPMQKNAKKHLDKSVDLLINPEIVHELLVKVDDNAVSTISLEEEGEKTEKGAEALFSEMLNNHPEGGKITSVLDAGGIFKNFDPIDIGSSLLRVLKEMGSDKKAVLFFSRSEGSTTADQFTIIQGNFDETTRKFVYKTTPLEDTSVQELKKYDLTPNDCVSFYDQRHCLGTDIRQPEDAIGLLTLDKGIVMDSACQAIMRLRQFLSGQKVSIVIPEHIAKRTPSIDPNCKLSDLVERGDMKAALLSIVLELLRSQSISRANDIYRSYNKALSNAVYQGAISELFAYVTMNTRPLTQDFYNLIEALSPVLYLATEDKPFELFGSLTEGVNSLESLKNRAVKMRAMIEDRLNNLKGVDAQQRDKIKSSILDKIDTLTAEICNEAEESIQRMMEEVESVIEGTSATTKDAIGTELQVTVEQVQEVTQEVEMTLEQELQRELSSYQFSSRLTPNPPSDWSGDKIKNFLKYISESKGEKLQQEGKIFSLREHLNANTQKEHSRNNTASQYQRGKKYGDLFDSNLFTTPHAIQPYDSKITVFEKRMPPMNHLLYIKRGGGAKPIGVFLSQSEAALFKKYLSQNQELYRDVHLVMCGGELLAGDLERLDLKNDEDFKRLNLQMNVLEGNASYLLRDLKTYRKWVTEKPQVSGSGQESDNPLQKLKFNFLKLKAELKSQDPKSNEKNLVYSYLIKLDRIQSFIARDSLLDLQKIEDAQIKMLSPEDVADLAPELVPRLSLEQIAGLTSKEQIEMLGNDSAKIQRVSPEAVSKLSRDQICFIGADQIQFVTDPDMVAAISPDLFTHLNIQNLGESERRNFILNSLRQEQIRAIKNRSILNCLPRVKLQEIDKSQVALFGTEDRFEEVFGEIRRNEELLSGLSEEQVIKIEDSRNDDALNELPAAFIKKIQRVETLKKIEKPKAIEALTKKQILEQHYPHLTKSQVEFYNNETEDSEVIRKLPVTKIRHIVPSMQKVVSDEQIGQVGSLSDVDLNSLPASFIKRVKDKPVLERFTTKDSIQALEKEQILESHYGHLSETQVKFFNKEEDKEVINKLPKEQQKHIALDMVKHLNVDKFAEIVENFAKIPTHLEEYCKIHLDLLGTLPNESLHNLPDNVIKLIGDKEVLKKFNTKESVVKLDQKQLLVEHAPYLSSTQVGKLDEKDADILKALPSDLRRFIDPQMVKHLGVEGILDKVKGLEIAHYSQLSAEQIQALSKCDKNEIAKLPKELQALLTRPEGKSFFVNAENKFTHILEAHPKEMRLMSRMQRVSYVIATLVLPIFSLIIMIPVSLIHYTGRICRLQLLNSLHVFIYRNLRRICQLGYYTITFSCCRK